MLIQISGGIYHAQGRGAYDEYRRKENEQLRDHGIGEWN